MKRRTDDQGPAVAAALMARTRHQCCRAGSELAVNRDKVSVWSTTRGTEKSLESSTWIRYDAAPVTSVQSSVTGNATVDWSAGLTSAGADGVADDAVTPRTA